MHMAADRTTRGDFRRQSASLRDSGSSHPRPRPQSGHTTLDQMLHAEEDAAQCDVSLHAKHGAVGVAAGEESGMLVVIDHGEAVHGSHEACAEHVPEIDSQEEESGLTHDKLLLAGLLPVLGELFNLRVLPGIQREQDDREDLRRREDAPKCDHARGLRNPIEIVPNTEHCSEEEEHDCDVRGALGLCFRNNAQLPVQLGDDHSGEDLERHLHPHVDHQPPPEVKNDEARLRGQVDGEEEEEEDHH